MKADRPRYVLIAETDRSSEGELWRFALHATDASCSIAACDCEPGASHDRLTLLAVVRGLEALDQPSDVTLVTPSPTIARGVTRDLADWRNNHWRWERFGRLTPIRDADLWRRVEHALRIHKVRCRLWRLDRPAGQAAPESIAPESIAPESIAPEAAAWSASVGEDGGSAQEARFVDGGLESPTMVIVPSPTARRRVRLASRSLPLAAG